mgnify:CR=1 FL=1
MNKLLYPWWNMKNILVLAIVFFGCFQMWERYANSPEPIYDEPYVAVYGRDSCSFTKRMISSLKSKGVNYHYFIVDDKSVASELHTRMESAGLSTRRYNLPVVDVNGDILVRPTLSEVLSEYDVLL